MTATRTSPLSKLLQDYGPTWIDIAGMALPASFVDADTERSTANDLALCDVSGFCRFVLKGKDAAAYLEEAGIALSDKINGVAEIDGGGLVIRTGGAEWMVEEPPCPPILGEDKTVAVERLRQLLRQGCRKPSAHLVASHKADAFISLRTSTLPPGLGESSLSEAGGSYSEEGSLRCYSVPAPGASFLLSGARASDVLLETCNVDLRSPEGDLVMTRVAGVSCYILFRTLNGIPAFQFWTDASYAHYLGETLLEIIQEHNGGVAGVSCYFPEVSLPQT